MEIAVRTIFEQLYFVALEGVGVNWKKNFFKLSNLHSKTSKNSKKNASHTVSEIFFVLSFQPQIEICIQTEKFPKKISWKV